MSLSKYSNSFRSSKIFYKKLLFNILQKRQNKEEGFTLIELLVAMVILTIVVGMTGTGLVFVMSKNTSSDGEITQQANLRRALDFIGDEIRAASVVSQTQPANPTWNFNPTPSSTAAASILYLEIPTPVEGVSSTTLTVPNHGLVKGNAVRISGTGLPSGINTNDTYYVSGTYVPANQSDATNKLELLTSNGSSTINFGTTVPPNFAIRRLVFYYPVTYIDGSGWKGREVLYRSTGDCSSASTTADPANCLVMVDSLVALPTTLSKTDSPFFTELVGSKQATISLNAQLCNPPSMANVCDPTPAPPEKPTNRTNVSLTAISRATLQ